MERTLTPPQYSREPKHEQKKKPHLSPCESGAPPHIGRDRGFSAEFMLREKHLNFITYAGAAIGPANEIWSMIHV